MYKNWRSFCGIFALSSSLLLAVGCGTSGNTFVRAVNASPGLTAYAYYIQVGPVQVAFDLPYGTEGVTQPGQNKTDTSGQYCPVGAGIQTVEVFFTKNVGLKKENIGLILVKKDLVKNGHYTIVSVGTFPHVHLLVLYDQNIRATSGHFRLRVINAAASSGGVDVYLTAPGASAAGSTPILTNFQFGEVTQTYFELIPGKYELQITAAGNPSNVLVEEPFTPVVLRTYSAFVIDPAPGSSQFKLLVTNEEAAKK